MRGGERVNETHTHTQKKGKENGDKGGVCPPPPPAASAQVEAEVRRLSLAPAESPEGFERTRGGDRVLA